MGLKQSILQIHSELDRVGVDHALIGGFALAIHGINRATGDIDLMIDASHRDLILTTLGAMGFHVKQVSHEFLHLEGPVRLDILLAQRPISREMLARAQSTPLMGGIKYLGAEDLIGLKIQAYCNDPRRVLQDQADIQFLINGCVDLDWDQIKIFADLFDQWPTIQALKSIP